MDNLLQKIIEFTKSQEDIRAVILSGSTARNDKSSDSFSDLDIAIYSTDVKKYESSNNWIKDLDEVWVYLPLETDEGYSTRLVIFNEGKKVDFTLLPISQLQEEIESHKLSDLNNRGYTILVDKDNIASKLPKPEYKAPPYILPTEQKFIAIVEEFWFEIYHIAKYLKREDLWAAKFRDWGVKELLLQMLVLYEKTEHGTDYDTWHLGIKIKNWVEPEIYSQLYGVFPHFDSSDSWNSLFKTMELYRKLAINTGNKLGYTYPQQLDNKITNFIIQQNTPQ